jgi:hypothetical protein
MNQLVKPIIPFGMVPNALLNSNKISLKAKGLFAFMNSKPDGWSFSVEKISFQCKEAKSSISEGLKELEDFGYLVRKKQSTGKSFIVKYHVYFKPKKTTPITDYPTKENPMKENPMKENPMKEKPLYGKSVNNSKKELSNKDNSNKEEREECSLAFFEINYPSRFESLMIKFKKQINDYQKFEQLFEATVLQENLQYDGNVIEGRFTKFAIYWISNQNKYDSPVIELNANQPKRKLFTGY